MGDKPPDEEQGFKWQGLMVDCITLRDDEVRNQALPFVAGYLCNSLGDNAKPREDVRFKIQQPGGSHSFWDAVVVFGPVHSAEAGPFTMQNHTWLCMPVMITSIRPTVQEHPMALSPMRFGYGVLCVSMVKSEVRLAITELLDDHELTVPAEVLATRVIDSDDTYRRVRA